MVLSLALWHGNRVVANSQLLAILNNSKTEKPNKANSSWGIINDVACALGTISIIPI